MYNCCYCHKGFRKHIKEEFWKNRRITEQDHVSKVWLEIELLWVSTIKLIILFQLVSEAKEAERFLRQNVVQVVQTKDDTYSEWSLQLHVYIFEDYV